MFKKEMKNCDSNFLTKGGSMEITEESITPKPQPFNPPPSTTTHNPTIPVNQYFIPFHSTWNIGFCTFFLSFYVNVLLDLTNSTLALVFQSPP